MYSEHMSRTVVDVDDAALARAQRAMQTSTKRDTINSALELAAAVQSNRRTQLLEEFRDLLDRLDVDRIEADEVHDHAERAG
jgi:Arc/MetJ family transcription regulator